MFIKFVVNLNHNSSIHTLVISINKGDFNNSAWYSIVSLTWNWKLKHFLEVGLSWAYLITEQSIPLSELDCHKRTERIQLRITEGIFYSVCFSSVSSMSRFRSSGGKHACDDLFIISGECTGDRSHVEPPCSADQGHDIYGPSFSWEGGQRLYPKGATGGRHFFRQ